MRTISRRRPMSSLIRLFSQRRDRAVQRPARVGGVRIRRGALAKAAATLSALCGIVFAPTAIAGHRHDDRQWVATWSVSPQPAAAPVHISGQTVRQVVHTSLGGERVRVRFSNAYGAAPL